MTDNPYEPPAVAEVVRTDWRLSRRCLSLLPLAASYAVPWVVVEWARVPAAMLCCAVAITIVFVCD